jgi:hypothetical protein
MILLIHFLIFLFFSTLDPEISKWTIIIVHFDYLRKRIRKRFLLVFSYILMHVTMYDNDFA